MDKLTPPERRWLKSRVCGLCEISLMSRSCGDYFPPTRAPRCNMDEKRAAALATYKPRNPK